LDDTDGPDPLVTDFVEENNVLSDDLRTMAEYWLKRFIRAAFAGFDTALQSSPPSRYSCGIEECADDIIIIIIE